MYKQVKSFDDINEMNKFMKNHEVVDVIINSFFHIDRHVNTYFVVYLVGGEPNATNKG